MGDVMELADMPPLADRRPDELLLPAEAAAYLRTTTGALDNWRRRYPGRAPTYVRLGDGPKAPVRYPVADLRAWIKAQTVSSGGDTPASAA